MKKSSTVKDGVWRPPLIGRIDSLICFVFVQGPLADHTVHTTFELPATGFLSVKHTTASLLETFKCKLICLLDNS